jgi:hypothetical protein
MPKPCSMLLKMRSSKYKKILKINPEFCKFIGMACYKLISITTDQPSEYTICMRTQGVIFDENWTIQESIGRLLCDTFVVYECNSQAG